MGSMAQGLRDGYSGGRAKGCRGDGQGGIDSVLSSCKGRGLDGNDGGFLRLSNLIKGKLRIFLGYLPFEQVGSYRGSPISDQLDTGFEVVFQVFRVALSSSCSSDKHILGEAYCVHNERLED